MILAAPKRSTTTTLNTNPKTRKRSISCRSFAPSITAAIATPFRTISRGRFYFLDGKLADGIFDAYRKDDIIKKFLTNTAAPEIDVDVKKVALEDMQSLPYKARVDFYMVYYSPADHSELKRDLYTANFVFIFKSQVPNELIPVNPLGLSITYFREDEAFK
jgi:hypothetical protein